MCLPLSTSENQLTPSKPFQYDDEDDEDEHPEVYEEEDINNGTGIFLFIK